jgi:hypothetical protein
VRSTIGIAIQEIATFDLKPQVTPQHFIFVEWDWHHSKERVPLPLEHSDSGPKYSDHSCRVRKKRDFILFKIAVSINCNRFSKMRRF